MKLTFSEPNNWGFFNITIANCGEIKGCKYKEGEKDGKRYAFVALPQHKITGKDGTDKWVGDLFLERKVMDEITTAYKEQIKPVEDEPQRPFDAEEEIPF